MIARAPSTMSTRAMRRNSQPLAAVVGSSRWVVAGVEADEFMREEVELDIEMISFQYPIKRFRTG
jgi:hypothetical protein